MRPVDKRQIENCALGQEQERRVSERQSPPLNDPFGWVVPGGALSLSGQKASPISNLGWRCPLHP